MRVVQRDPDSLKPYKANPRINDQAVEAVARSIQEFGFRQPIVADGKDVIIVGHVRWKAAKRLGLKTVPVHVAADLTEKQKKAYRVADNQTADLADWDYELLARELGDLQGVDFDLEVLGFPVDQLGALLEPELKEGLTDPDAIPEPPDKAITRRGDLCILGDHRLLCGDAGKGGDVDRLLDGARIHLVNTDPPYNVNVEPRSSTAIAAGQSSYPNLSGKMHHQGFDTARGAIDPKKARRKMRPKDRPLEGDFVSDEQFAKMLRAWFGQIARVLEPGRTFYIWGGYANCANYPAALVECELYFSQAIIWIKQHPVLPRKDFLGNHEWCFYGWRKGAAHWFAFGVNNVQDVWEISAKSADASDADQVHVGMGLILESPSGARLFLTPGIPDGEHAQVALGDGGSAAVAIAGPTDVWRIKKVPPQKMIHLTEKPVELAVRAMQCSSRRGENVLDLFAGSGSTLIAAEQLGRRCFGMEIDPLYCDVIVQRWEAFTGRQVERRSASAKRSPVKKRTRRAKAPKGRR